MMPQASRPQKCDEYDNSHVYETGQCETQTASCRLQTVGKMQTADFLTVYPLSRANHKQANLNAT